MILGLYIQNQRIDLFNDENVNLNKSVLNISDISKNTTAYTQTFSVPANENNNKLFKHYYNANIDGGFDARTKQDAFIRIDGLTFERGELRLTEVSLKSGLPSNYKLTFFGKAVNLSKIFAKDELSALDYDDLTFNYDASTVKEGLKNSLGVNGEIIFNLFSKNRLFYNSGANSEVTNIADNGTTAGIRFNQLIPSINVFNIIERIESKYDVKFSRQFFDRSEFKDLFLLLDAKKDNAQTFSERVDFNSGDDTVMNFTTDVGSYEIFYNDLGGFNNTQRQDYRHQLKVIPNSNESYKIKIFLNNELKTVKEVSGTYILTTATSNYVDIFSNQTYNLYYEIEAVAGFGFTTELTDTRTLREGVFVISSDTYFCKSSGTTLTGIYNINDNIPKIGVLDFLKGLFNAFKLVVEPLQDGTIYINDVNSYYDEGDLLDVTKYIDFSNQKITRGELFNEIGFEFQEPKTILNKEFTENTGTPYGDELTFINDENGEPIDGTSQNLKLPFEQIVYERLSDVNGGEQTNIQIGSIIDEEFKGVVVKPHIFYNTKAEVGTKKIAFINDDLTIDNTITSINTPSHTNTLEDSLYAFIFSQEFSTWNGQLISNNLYTNYHRKYIENTFNKKRRNYSFDAILPPNVIMKLSLNDVLKIDKQYYRILDYNLNLLDGKTKFNLTNAFDFNLRKLTPNNLIFYINKVAQSVTTYVTNGQNETFTFSYEDLGFGTNWVSTIQNENNIINSVQENTTGLEREIFVIVENNSIEQFRIYINQKGAENITADNTNITADNNQITI